MTLSGGVRLIVAQKFDPVLVAIQAFLKACGWNSSVRTYKFGSLLTVSRTEDCKLILRQLLLAGLRVKRESASAVLCVSPDNYRKVREHLQGLVGYQGRYKRLTTSGLDRSREIRLIGSRLRRTGDGEKSEIAAQLEQLKTVHKLESALERYFQIRADVRAVLQLQMQREEIG